MANKEKQIEEMARAIQNGELDRNRGILDCTEFPTDLVIKVGLQRLAGAKALYNAGYRKSTDVALEAVDNFQSRLKNIFCTMCCDNDYNTVCLLEINSAIESLFDVFIAELKKKYTKESEDTE